MKACGQQQRRDRVCDLPDNVVPIGDGSRENLMFLGDAADALATLLPEHESRVRLALLDPPYNTTSRFHHYEDSVEHDVWLAERREHLAIVRQLLSDDGSVWIHLDDSEMHYCKVMLDRLSVGRTTSARWFGKRA
jgi:adenine-specific DNA-methyltransferase